MDRNEAQGRAMLARGLATPELVDKAWHQAQARGEDLCAVLMAWGVIDAAQAAAIRATTPPSSRLVQTMDSARTQAVSPPSDSGEASPSAATKIESRRTRALGAGPGERVGGHAILEELSRGGMGVVFRARHKSLGEDVALKLMLSDEANQRDRARFEREARALFRLNHPSIVRLLDYGEDKGRMFLVMELIKGRTLEERITAMRARGEQPSLPWILKALRGVARALALGHAAGLVHRDLKPSNILIEDGTDRVVLIDFGIARVAPPSGGLSVTSLTGSGDVLGTPSYMAPEQFDRRSFGEISPATDIWAFGGLVFYCLSGAAPMSGTTLNIYNKLLKGERPKLEELCDPLPELAELCEGCFALEPAERWPMARVLRALARAGNRRQRHTAWAILGALALGLILGLTALKSRGEAGRWLVQPDAPSWVADERVAVTAYTDGPGSIIVERRTELGWEALGTLNADDSGEVSGKVEGLNEGRNRLRLAIQDGAKSQEFMVSRDTVKPSLKLDGLWRGFLPVRGGRLALRGEVTDGGPCTLRYRDASMPLPEGRLVWDLAIEPGDRVSLEVVDAAGNRALYQVKTVDGPRFDGCRAIQNLDVWRDAKPEVREQVWRETAENLGAGYSFIDHRQYRCGGQSHLIGRFRHEASGLVLHLIPGGLVTIGNADPERDLEYLNTLLRDRRDHFAKDVSLPKSPEELRADEPERSLRLPAFLIAARELSYDALVQVGSVYLGQERSLSRKPALMYSWLQFDKFLTRLGLRFPSEAEWEYAARAGTRTRYYWGEEYDPKHARNSPSREDEGPWSVDEEVPHNAFGLQDIVGNVWELCADPAPPGSLPKDAEGRVMRGGGWKYSDAFFARSSYRGFLPLTARSTMIGVRPARDLPGFDLEQRR